MCENNNNAMITKLVDQYKMQIKESLEPNLPMGKNEI